MSDKVKVKRPGAQQSYEYACKMGSELYESRKIAMLNRDGLRKRIEAAEADLEKMRLDLAFSNGAIAALKYAGEKILSIQGFTLGQ